MTSREERGWGMPVLVHAFLTLVVGLSTGVSCHLKEDLGNVPDGGRYSGGRSGSGGETASGGATATGGSTGSGGAVTTVGTTATGGAAASGGAAGLGSAGHGGGGEVATVGTTATGGATASDGAAGSGSAGRSDAGSTGGNSGGGGRGAGGITVSCTLGRGGTPAGAPPYMLAPPVNQADQRSPVSIAIADLNGDGKLDLAVANTTDGAGGAGGAGAGAVNLPNGSVTAYLNQGNNVFTTANYTAGPAPLSVAAGDVNGDGKIDIVVVNGNWGGNQTQNLQYPRGSLSVFLNNGNGTYAAGATYAAAPHPTSVAIGDVNGDGEADLAVTAQDGFSVGSGGDVFTEPSVVSILLNTGSGGFGTPTHYAVPNHHGARSVLMQDLNGDGKLDVVAAGTRNGSFTMLNNGDGTFAPSVTVGLGGSIVVVGDLNGDGSADLVTLNSGRLGVAFNDGAGGISCSEVYVSLTNEIWGAGAIGDINQDGNPDIVLAGGGVGVLLNRGGGNFGTGNLAAILTTDIGPDNAVSVALGDLNGDGKLDIVLATPTGVKVLMNTMP